MGEATVRRKLLRVALGLPALLVGLQVAGATALADDDDDNRGRGRGRVSTDLRRGILDGQHLRHPDDDEDHHQADAHAPQRDRALSSSRIFSGCCLV